MRDSMRAIAGMLVLLLCSMFGVVMQANANVGDLGMTVTPMRAGVVLNAGERYEGSFTVMNPVDGGEDLYYHIEAKPFYVDEHYNPVFERDESNDMQFLVDWVKVISGEKGKLAPGESAKIEYEINVPDDAPAGGQYAVLSAVTDIRQNNENGVNIGEGMAINHLILAEIAGETVVSGEISDIDIQGFMFDGMINAHSLVRNTGNVHGLATYKMGVYGLFSDEPLYINDGEIDDHYILPNRALFNETYWKETPIAGIFRVVYKVEFQGEVAEMSKIVIVCPIWLIALIVVGITIIVLRIASLIKIRKMEGVTENNKK